MAIGSPTLNSATPAQALYDAIVTVLDAHSNWTLVDTVSLSGTYYVWKNHGTGVTDNNSFGSDFYISIFVPTGGTGNVVFRAFEDYNAGSDLMIRPCMEDASNATNADASGLATGGVVLSTAAGAMTVTFTPAVAPNTSGLYIVASKNVLHVAMRRSDTSTVYSLYAGLFESRVTIANEFPLCMGANAAATTNISSVTFGTSRHPGRLSQAANTDNFKHTLTALTTISGDTQNSDLFRGQAQASKAALIANGGQTVAQVPTFGRHRGNLYDVIILPPASGVTLGIGDVLDDPSIDYWYMAYGAQNCWVDQSVV